jgi:hypothetical protein
MYNCARRSLVTWFAIALVFTAFSGIAQAAPETVTADTVSATIPADAELQSLTHTDMDSSLVVWRNADNRDRKYLALVGSDASTTSRQKLKSALSWETGEGKSHLVPALEVPGFIIVLNGFDRLAFPNKRKEGRRVYDTTPSTIWEHVSRQNWHFDKDSFDVNQFGHPYEGATMFGLARSTGLNFWQSLIYSNVGSFLWEMAGETTRPSINDQITTGNAGSLFGEALFRIAGLVLEDGGETPRFWHELTAAAVSPPTGFNRFVFGDRFKSTFPSHKPAALWRAILGGSIDTHSSNLIQPAQHHDVNLIADFAMAYGLPGKPGYTYNRPFDYFDFQLSTRSRVNNLLEAVTIRGLLIGTEYQMGNDYRGIWGLYGSYDYISPHLFRVSSTAVSLGTTSQYWIAPGVALQGSLLGGIGFGAAGTETVATDGRGYHYGATPQGLLTMSLLFGDRTMLDFTGRSYYVSATGPDHSPGSELVFRGNAGVTVRVSGSHAVGIQYVESIRDTYYHQQPRSYRSEGTISLAYTFLSDTHFGAVEWRDAAVR